MKKKPKMIDGVEVIEVPKNATLKQIYACARAAFTAGDLAKFAEIDTWVPAQQVVSELWDIHQKESKRRKKKK